MTNLGVVQRVFALFSEGKLEEILQHVAPDFIWTYYGPSEVEWAGTYRGHQGMREFFEIVARCRTVEKFVVTEFIDAGPKIVVRGVSQARLISNSARYSAQWVNIFTLDDGRICALEDLYDTGSIVLALRATKPS